MQVGTFELTMFIMFLYKQESDPDLCLYLKVFEPGNLA